MQPTELTPTFETWVMISVVLALLIYEVWLYVAGKETISETIRRFSNISYMIPFIAGVLCGHFWW
jgi:hypothetical protein